MKEKYYYCYYYLELTIWIPCFWPLTRYVKMPPSTTVVIGAIADTQKSFGFLTL